MNLLHRLDRAWYQPAPAERLALLRMLVGAFAVVYLSVRYLSLTSITRFDPSQFAPVGPIRLLALPLSALWVHAAIVLAIVTGACFFAGFRFRVTGPVFALLFLWVTSYRSSWGMIFHNENLVALHLILLSVAPAADVLSVDAQRTSSPRTASPMMATAPHGRYGWAIRAICAVTVASYVLAGLAKLRLAGWHWADGDVLRTQVAYDNLRKVELGSLHSPLGAALVSYPWPFRALSWGSLLLELGAPMALTFGLLARGWVLGVFLFHVGVLLLMAIAFPYPLSFVAYVSFFPLEQSRHLRFLQRWFSHREASTSGG